MSEIFLYKYGELILGEWIMTNPMDTTYNDALTLLRYNNGVKDNGYSLKDAALGAGVVVGGYSVWNGGKWAWKNRHDYKTGWQNLKDGYNKAKTLKGANLKDSYLNNYRTNYISDLEKQYPAQKTLSAAEQAKLKPSQLAKYNRQQAISAEYNRVRQLIQDSKSLRGQDLLNKKHEINQAISEAKLAVARGKATPGSAMAPTTKIGKAGQWLKAKTGITKADLAIKSAAANGNKFVRVLTKAPKGTPLTMIAGMALESGTVIDTYKKLGAGKGTKQLGKSAAIVGAGVLGYAAGSAALGAAVGSVVPIAGTAVGAVVGLIGGLLGAWGADTLARKAMPSELELDAQKKAQEVTKSPEKMQELLKETETKAANETDKATLAVLQKSYDNLTAKVTPTDSNTQTTGGNTQNGAGKASNKLKQTLENIQNLLKTGWNFFNPQDVYSVLKPYEKPTYQQLMGSYGWAA